MYNFLLAVCAVLVTIKMREFAVNYAPASDEEKNAAFLAGDHPLIDGYDDFYDRKILSEAAENLDDQSIF